MWGPPAHPGKMGSRGARMEQAACLEQSLVPGRLKILLSLKQSPQGHSQRAAATLVPLGLSQDDVQDASVGRGNVVCEAADTGEDLGFCRVGCEPETISSSSGLAGKDGAFSLAQVGELLSRGG